MAVKKEKAAVAVPQTYEAANAVLEEHGRIMRDLGRVEERLAGKVAKLTAQVEAGVTPLRDRLKVIEAELEAYAAENREALTEKGKVKHHDMPAGRIGWRAKPPSVSFKRGLKAEDVVAAIKDLCTRLGRARDYKLLHVAETFIRTRQEPNKETMLAAPELALQVDGVKIGSGGETFYVEPTGAALSGGEP